MKIAEISPVLKKLDNTWKDNYWPISTLSSFTNFLAAKRLYIKKKIWKYLTDFRKNYNTQNSLLAMLETWKAMLNNGLIWRFW